MRSLGFTFLLMLAAVVFCGMAAWQWNRGNFDSLLGTPPTPVGGLVYSSFTPDQVKHIQITLEHTGASFSLIEDGWQASSPWNDRMDPRSAVELIYFTLGMRVEDFARLDEIDPDQTGLNGSAIRIRLEDENHRPLAKYKLGKATQWKAEADGRELPVPTVFVQPHDKHRKRHVYAATGDINALFKDDLKHLRDHRPFYFNPITLSVIRIHSQKADLVLGRETPDGAWRIVMPLDLPTDPAAIKTLIEGLYELKAVKVEDRAEVTLPATNSPVKSTQIAIKEFGTDTETLLDILPPDPPEATLAKATVSDRPDTVFDLPLKPEPGRVTLADLPLSVNELRDPTLTHLNIQSLSGISIDSSTSPEILIARDPPQPWMATVSGVSSTANEENLYALLKAVTTTRAIGFESDAATDFSPWGLDRPFLTLRFLGQNNQGLELRFGIDSKGGFFVNRTGTPTVMRVDESLIKEIATNPFEWRHSLLWSVNRVNLIGIERKFAGSFPLLLKYEFIDESWQAEQDGKDLSATLSPTKANYMLSILEGLKVSRWLAASDEAAATALQNPALTFSVMEKTFDEEGNFTGVQLRHLALAPASSAASPAFYFGRLSNEPHPFLITRQVFDKLAADLFEE